MSADRAGRVEEIFLVAAELPSDQRDAYLTRECGGDAPLRREVESLLSHHTPENDFLDSKHAPGRSLLSQFGAAALPAEEATLPPDRRIGSYTILGLLGQGGMGVVYVARQERPSRTVALKVLRTGAGSARLLRRFEYEAEVLGRLQHPGIAQVYEAGIYKAGGLTYPFIAMELIQGRTLVRHAEEHGLDFRARLELFARVCDAVHHAHQHGVIHRDLKPANILVAQPGPGHTGADAQPKVLDFGVARAMDTPDGNTTTHTSVGQIIGTLPYMSPEQIAGNSDQIDVRSDVYALGVVLYELLSGRLPYDVKSRSLPDAARVIRDEPPTRLSTVARVFRGDIETIVSTALAKEKARRYQSAAALAADARRFLTGEPLEARRDSAMYVLRSQIRRYKGVVAAATAALIALIAFAVYAAIQAERQSQLAGEARKASTEALRAKGEAETERDRADDAARSLAAQLQISNIERGRALAAAGNLRAAEELIWPEHLKSPNDSYPRWALWEVYLRHPCLFTLVGHTSGVLAVAVSPDGASAATTGRDGSVRIWSLTTGRCLRTLATTGIGLPSLWSIAWSTDGRAIAVGDSDGFIHYFNLDLDQSFQVLRAASRTIRSIVFSNTGDLFSCGEDGSVRRWTGLLTGTPVFTAYPLAAGLSCMGLALSPDERRLAGITVNGEILLWDVQAPTLPRQWHGHDGGGRIIAFLPDGRRLISGGSDRAAHLWDIDTATKVRTFYSGKWPISDLAISPDGNTLVTTGWVTIDLWDIPSGRKLRTLTGHTSTTSAAAFSPDGRFILTGGDDATTRVWELQPRGYITRLPGHTVQVNECAWSSDGKVIATAAVDGNLRLCDGQTGALIDTRSAHAGGVSCLAFSPKAPLIATAGRDGMIRLWRTDQSAPVAELSGHTGEIHAVRFTDDGAILLSGGRDRSLRTWSIPDGKPGPWGVPSQSLIGYIAPVDGANIVALSPTRGIQLWDALAAKSLGRLDTASTPSSNWFLTALHDRRTLVASTWDGSVQWWDIQQRRLTRTIKAHDQLVSSVAVNADDTIMAAASVSGSIRLFDTTTGRLLLSIEEHDGNVLGMCFSPDGTRLATAGDDGKALLIDLRRSDSYIEGNRAYWSSGVAGNAQPKP